MPRTYRCATCNADFTDKPSSERKYCSRECELADASRKRHGIIVSCATCGEQMYAAPRAIRRNKHGLYHCSRECYNKSMQTQRVVTRSDSRKPMADPIHCDQCDKVFVRPPSALQSKTRFCSKKCAYEYRKGKRGTRRRKWLEPVSLYRGMDWKEQSTACKKRDNYTCQRCSATSVRVDAHHIVPYRISHDNSLKNLITLCRPCHNTVEAEYWRTHPTNQLRLL